MSRSSTAQDAAKRNASADALRERCPEHGLRSGKRYPRHHRVALRARRDRLERNTIACLRSAGDKHSERSVVFVQVGAHRVAHVVDRDAADAFDVIIIEVPAPDGFEFAEPLCECIRPVAGERTLHGDLVLRAQ